MMQSKQSFTQTSLIKNELESGRLKTSTLNNRKQYQMVYIWGESGWSTGYKGKISTRSQDLSLRAASG